MVLFFFILQVFAAGIIVVFLKDQLDRILLAAALKDLEYGFFTKRDPELEHGTPDWTLPLIIITHKKISETNRQKILKVAARTFPPSIMFEFQENSKILGGIIIKHGTKILDCSLANRLSAMN